MSGNDQKKKFDVDGIKARHNIVDVIGEVVSLKKKSAHDFHGLCPFHDEKTPSFTVNENDQMYYCFGCGAGGDVIKFYEDYNNTSFIDACKALGGETDVEFTPSFEKKEARKPVDYYEGISPIVPAPGLIEGDSCQILNPKKVEEYGFTPKRWSIKAAWPYTLEDGSVSHFVVRSEIPEEIPVQKAIETEMIDSLLGDAAHHIAHEQKASISNLQRHLRIGYNRAAIMIEQLEKLGVVSIPSERGQREVLVAKDYEFKATKMNKLTPAVYWCSWPNGGHGWTLYKKKENNVIFNLHNIVKNPEAIVCLCEGEKAAQMGIDQTQDHFAEKYVFSCWPGGTNGTSSVDWSSLAGRKVLLLPDYDPVGFKTMRGYTRKGDKKVKGVIEYLEEVGAEFVGCVIPPEDMPKGWDIADKDGKREAAWQPGELIQFIEGRKRKKVQRHPLEKAKGSDEGEKSHSELPEEWPEFRTPPEEEDYNLIDLSDAPFRVLGYSKDKRFYLPNSTQQILELTPSQHTKNQLISLAPLEYWCAKFSNGRDAKKIDWLQAANMLLKLSAEQGLFDLNNGIRGRGAWLDSGKAVLHLGEQIFVDGDEYTPEEIDSKYIYEKNYSLGHVFEKAATDEEAQQLLSICSQFNWENPLSGQLLAGWCVCASVCGILDWRPHVWVTGASGSGKSTIVNNVVKPFLGQFVIKTEGKTTEAGLRQTVGKDAISIIFDEAEAEDKRSAARLQEILDLARVSSSGGVITKGSQDGSGVAYCVRSCFCFSAINHSVKHLADENRFTMLVVNPNVNFDKEKFQNFMIHIQETITEEYSAKMFARVMENLDVFLKNIKVFRDAANVILGSARIADQIGTLLAGAYLCQYDAEIAPEDARSWIDSLDWGDHTTANSSSDLERLLSKMATTRINVHYEHERYNISIGEAIVSASRSAEQDSILDKMHKEAHAELRRHGFKIFEPQAGEDYQKGVLVANSCDPLRKILDDTPWSVAWQRTLKDHPQAIAPNNVFHFAPGIKQRAVLLPLDAFMTK